MAYDDDENENDAVPDSSDDSESGASADDIPLSPKPLNPMVADYLNSKQQLADAQDESRRNQMLTGLARASASLSAGLAHSNQPVNDAPFQAMDKADQAPVQNVLNAQKSQSTELQNQQSLMANQKQAGDEDPTSVQSKAAQKLIKSLYPGKFDDATLDTMSKAQIGDSIMKPLELDEKIKEHADEQRNKVLDRANAQKDKIDAKKDADQQKAQDFAMTKIDAARSDPAVKTAQTDLYAAQKIKSLIAQYPDPDHLADWQVRALSGEVAKLAQGGVPGQHELDGIVPSTLIGKMGKAWGDIIDKPTSANAGAFIRQFQGYADNISGDARSQIKGKIDSVLNIKRSDMGDDRYQKMRSSYYTRFGLGDPDSSSAEAGNDHASRAAQILAQRRAAKSAQAPAIPIPNYANPSAGVNASPSLMLPPDSGSVAEDGFAYGGTVPQPPGFHPVKMQATPHLAKPAQPHLAVAPAMVMPAGMKPMTRAQHFDQGGTVQPGNGLMPDPQLAREAAAGMEHGETLADGWKNLKAEFGLDKSQAKPKGYACGGTVHNYQHGGTVPGQPPVGNHNDPRNDVTPIVASPGEEVLPLSVTKSHSPAMAAYLHMKSKGYK